MARRKSIKEVMRHKETYKPSLCVAFRRSSREDVTLTDVTEQFEGRGINDLCEEG
jgi:hypothetical protein